MSKQSLNGFIVYSSVCWACDNYGFSTVVCVMLWAVQRYKGHPSFLSLPTHTFSSLHISLRNLFTVSKKEEPSLNKCSLVKHLSSEISRNKTFWKVKSHESSSLTIRPHVKQFWKIKNSLFKRKFSLKNTVLFIFPHHTLKNI